MSFRVVRADELVWEERPARDGGPPRLAADLTPTAGLARSRARMWRYPPGTRGRRHRETEQEEVFVVLEGTATLLLGDPPERHDLPTGSVACVEPGTAIQVRNEGDADALLLVYGAPPVQGAAEYLDDVEL